MQPATTERALIYYRCSTEAQAQSGLGLEAQERACTTYCSQRGLYVARSYADEGVTSRQKLCDRPAGKELMVALAQAELAQDWTFHLVTYSMSRLWRSFQEGALDLEALRAQKITVHLVKERLVLGDAQSMSAAEKFAQKIILSTMLASVEFERDMISERTVEALAEKAARGEPVGRAPFGFRYRHGKLVPDDAELRILGACAIQRSKGISWPQTAKALNAWSWTTRAGKKWSSESCRALMRERSKAHLALGTETYLDWLRSRAGLLAPEGARL